MLQLRAGQAAALPSRQLAAAALLGSAGLLSQRGCAAAAARGERTGTATKRCTLCSGASAAPAQLQGRALQRGAQQCAPAGCAAAAAPCHVTSECAGCRVLGCCARAEPQAQSNKCVPASSADKLALNRCAGREATMSSAVTSSESQERGSSGTAKA